MTITNSVNYTQTPAASFSQYVDTGSWTPVIAGATTAGVGTYTLRVGSYTRIANLLFFTGTVTWTAHTGTGNMLLTGLPFTSRNTANVSYDAQTDLTDITLPAATVQIMGEIAPNTTQITLDATRSNNTNTPVQMDASGTVDVTGFYLI